MGCCFQKRTSTKQSVNRRTRTTNSTRLARGGILGLCWLLVGAQRPVFVVSGHLETSRRAPGLGSSAQILGGWQVMACDSGMQGRFVLGLYSSHALFPGFFASTRIDFVFRFPFCYLLKQMTLPYSPTIQLLPSDLPRIIRNGFIHCDIFLVETTSIVHLGYCLHCKRIFSLSWAKKHSKRLRNASLDVSRLFKADKVDLYRQDILSELELLFENGRFSRNSFSVERVDVLRHRFDAGSADLPGVYESDCFEHLQVDQSSEPSEAIPQQDSQTDPSDESDRRYECIQECLLSSSFYGSEFDAHKFLRLTESMMNTTFATSDDNTRNTVKASIVSSFIRKISTLLSLTKSQNDQLLKFWKTMIVFISPSSEEIVKRVHASYNSCVRQSIRDGKEKKRQCQRYMEGCSFFSIAIDSALVGNEHLFACFSRFCFEDSVVQIPLFLTFVTGPQEMTLLNLSSTSSWTSTQCLKNSSPYQPTELQT